MLLLLFCVPRVSFAAQVCSADGVCQPYTSSSDGYILADVADPNAYFTSLSIGGSGSGRIEFYDALSGAIVQTISLSGPVTVTPNSGAYSFKLFADSGQFYAVEAYSTSVNTPHVTFTSPSTSSGGGGSSVSTANLEAINESIHDAVLANGVDLGGIQSAIESNGGKLDGISNILSGIKGDLEGTKVPQYPNKPTFPKLDDYAPDQPSTSFKDDTSYFTDQGDASTPPAFPVGKEPTDNWDGIFKESPLVKDVSKVKDPLLTKDLPLSPDALKLKDPVLTREKQEKDPVLIREKQEKDPILTETPKKTKDAILTRVKQSQTPLLVREKQIQTPVLERQKQVKSPVLSSTNGGFQRNNFYNQTEKYTQQPSYNTLP